jgi:DNA (cytosine-5)-methyltransferase 1
MVYYNENDPKAAAWLRDLITQGNLPDGDVDERSIADVKPGDLDDYDQCHFFAGIGGWALALEMAGWTGPVWTGSCPCQPFSAAGKQKGIEDDRHLFPVWAKLIAECKPPTVFGEQVASPLGRQWLSGVFTEMEGLGYASAGADLCAASVGAPHIRQRLFWVVNADSASQERQRQVGVSVEPKQEAGRPGAATAWSPSGLIGCADRKSRRIKPGIQPLAHGVSGRVGLLRGYGNAIVPQVAAEFIGAYMDT